jgi:hypothetical protein
MRRAVEIRPALRRDTFRGRPSERTHDPQTADALSLVSGRLELRVRDQAGWQIALGGGAFGARPTRVNVQTTRRRVPESDRSVLCGERSAMSVTTAIDRCLHFTS